MNEICLLRNELGYTQQQLSELTGYSRSAISAWESSTRKAPKHIPKLIKVLIQKNRKIDDLENQLDKTGKQERRELVEKAIERVDQEIERLILM